MAPVESPVPPAPLQAETQSAQMQQKVRGQPESSTALTKVEEVPAEEVDELPVQEEEIAPSLSPKGDDEQQTESNYSLSAEPAPDDQKGEGANVLTFQKAKSNRGRKARAVYGPDSIYVDPVHSSKNKWTLRVRWIEPDGKRPILTARSLSLADYSKLKRSKKNYEAYTKQLIAVCRSRALRTGYGTDRRASGLS